MFHIFTVVIDCARFPEDDTGKFECVYPPQTDTTPQKTKNFVALKSLEIPEKINCSKLQPDTKTDSQPDTQLNIQPDTQPDTQPVTKPDTQTKSMFSKPKYVFNTESKAALENRIPKEPIYGHNVYVNDETDNTYEHKMKSEDSVATSVSKQVEDLSYEINSEQSARDGSKHSKNSKFFSLTTSNLLRKVHDAGTQFARLLLSYFLIHLQSTTGISTLPNVVLESQKLRDSLYLRMTSPSMFFATPVKDS